MDVGSTGSGLEKGGSHTPREVLGPDTGPKAVWSGIDVVLCSHSDAPGSSVQGTLVLELNYLNILSLPYAEWGNRYHWEANAAASMARSGLAESEGKAVEADTFTATDAVVFDARLGSGTIVSAAVRDKYSAAHLGAMSVAISEVDAGAAVAARSDPV